MEYLSAVAMTVMADILYVHDWKWQLIGFSFVQRPGMGRASPLPSQRLRSMCLNSAVGKPVSRAMVGPVARGWSRADLPRCDVLLGGRGIVLSEAVTGPQVYHDRATSLNFKVRSFLMTLI